VASYQQAIVETLVRQTRKAQSRLQPKSILLVGGVACNSLLRHTFKKTFEEEPRRRSGNTGIPVYYPSPILTTDNAAMIAAAGTRMFPDCTALDLELNPSANLRLC
jgi:N6-L-threonylcarbamoyladenine synthase